MPRFSASVQSMRLAYGYRKHFPHSNSRERRNDNPQNPCGELRQSVLEQHVHNRVGKNKTSEKLMTLFPQREDLARIGLVWVRAALGDDLKTESVETHEADREPREHGACDDIKDTERNVERPVGFMRGGVGGMGFVSGESVVVAVGRDGEKKTRCEVGHDIFFQQL